MDIQLALLTAEDAAPLLAFEHENRAFFESMVPGRGDAYYQPEVFQERHGSLLNEQQRGGSRFYLIKDQAGYIIGRINLIGIDRRERQGELGYRVGGAHVGKGVAAKAVGLLLAELPAIGIERVEAKTTEENIASQRVLEKSGFQKIKEPIGKLDEERQGFQFVHYQWQGKQKKNKQIE